MAKMLKSLGPLSLGEPLEMPISSARASWPSVG